MRNTYVTFRMIGRNPCFLATHSSLTQAKKDLDAVYREYYDGTEDAETQFHIVALPFDNPDPINISSADAEKCENNSLLISYTFAGERIIEPLTMIVNAAE